MSRSLAVLPALALQLLMICVAPKAIAHTDASTPEPVAQAAEPDDMPTMHAHERPAMDGMQMDEPGMLGVLGPHPMTREGSGTSWQPDATPHMGLHRIVGDWSVMAHGYVNAVEDRQTGPRGGTKAFTESMVMLMGMRPAGAGTLGLRAMASLDPTQGRRGYPLLFETGETADGTTPLVDRQHPHDLFMELAASYSLRLGDEGAAFVYLGLPGEPALGPTAFMHRFSGMRNPEAPLTHHWLDSTHITDGVATIGASSGRFQLEGSWFNGREPDQHRWDIETRRFDSWSARLSFNPAPAWSMQVSFGDLKSPEQLEPETRVRRTTASITYHVANDGNPWATTLAYGRNHKANPSFDRTEPGWLLESTYVMRDTHTVFARAEQVRNSELFDEGTPLAGQAFTVRKLTVGYIHDFATTGPLRWGLGGLVGYLRAPARLDPEYGGSPRSYMLFLQGRL